MTRRIIFLLFALLLEANVSAQVMPRAGTHFSFGIPEGSDGLIDPTLGSGQSLLLVNILSMYDGKGIITSPNGYCQDFTFTADSVTTIELPYSFMHLRDIGKTNKGVLIKTSQPSCVVFHDFLQEAGEATQIYPDDALDTSYRITTWGLFDDPTEDNHTQFVITATQDNTDVTIVPSVLTLGNHPANVPITTTLNRGECYMVKADTNGLPLVTSLSNSTVRSTKPVSIIAGVSCGYNPLGVESCDELLDEVLPMKYSDTIFYVVPLRDSFVTNTVLFTSEVKAYFVIPSNGAVTSSTNGRAEINISGPTSFQLTTGTNVPALAQCFLLSEGSDRQITGDPSIVTILPRSQYVDTLIWYTPAFTGPVQFSPGPFLDYVSVVYPKLSEAQVLLDGSPITSRSFPQPIGASPMQGAVALIKPGVHRLTSPVPIFATVSGFADADGYSFLPGTVAPQLPEDTIPTLLD
ncbi:MAG: IgGFc-binding protein, partial [Candidatus Kapaibacterium sp.]